MSYDYSKSERVQTKTNYMYSEFSGHILLDDYLSNRIANLDNVEFETSTADAYIKVQRAISNLVSVDQSSELDDVSQINSMKLLESILVNLVSGNYLESEKWLFRFMQRYEVNKKLYSFYGSDFREVLETKLLLKHISCLVWV